MEAEPDEMDEFELEQRRRGEETRGQTPRARCRESGQTYEPQKFATRCGVMFRGVMFRGFRLQAEVYNDSIRSSA